MCWWVEDSQRKQEMQVSPSLRHRQEPVCPEEQVEAAGASLCPKGHNSNLGMISSSARHQRGQEGTAEPGEPQAWSAAGVSSLPLLDNTSDL